MYRLVSTDINHRGMGGELRCGVAFRARAAAPGLSASGVRSALEDARRVFAFRGAFSAQKPAFPAFEHQRG